MKRTFFRILPVIVVAGLLAPAGPASQPAAYDVKENYHKAEHDVPMRDGVRLHTTVYTPRRAAGPVPILLLRTPYGTGPYGDEAYRAYLGPSRHSSEFEQAGYIFVFQDVRGKYRSEGEFTVMRPHRPGKGPRDTDESSDTYDTIEWLLANVPGHNGRVGMWGISYPGFQVVHGMIEAHPALRAASPQASPSDMWIGDDFHHSGAFRLQYTFSWLWGSAQVRSGPSDTGGQRLDPGTPDGYRFFLDLGPLSNVNKLYFHDRVPEWNLYMEHGDYDEYWQRQNPLPHLHDIRMPVLHVASWFDAEDFYGPMTIYQQIEKLNPDNQSVLVVGPWTHGGWNSHPDGNSIGHMQFAGAPSRHFRDRVQFPFFERYLRDGAEPDLPEALVYESGLNEWRSYDAWPPRQIEQRKLYLRAGGRLSFDPPSDKAEAADSYVSDPARPVPSTAEVRFNQGHTWMVEDQRFASRRPDVLVYSSEPLPEDLTVSGQILANLIVSCTGTDSDYIVKIIDEYPGGATDPEPNPTGIRMGHAQLLVAGEVMRAKYRNSWSAPEPLVPNKPVAVQVDLRDRNHRFRKGHRIMVHVQSTWFPVIDRNPQVFTNIYRATEADYRKATQTIHRSADMASHLVLPVLRSGN
jgi:uncharacterized protein